MPPLRNKNKDEKRTLWKKNNMMKNRLGTPVSQRQLRVGEMIKQSLGMIFVRNEAKVPNLVSNRPRKKVRGD